MSVNGCCLAYRAWLLKNSEVMVLNEAGFGLAEEGVRYIGGLGGMASCLGVEDDSTLLAISLVKKIPPS
jgi:hypothetical protein